MKLLVCGKVIFWPYVKKLLIIMKLMAFLILVTALHVSANTFSQKVSISGEHIPLEKVFELIRIQTGYQFVYPKAILEKSLPVTLQLENVELTEALNACLKKQKLSFEITDKIIVIKEQTRDADRETHYLPLATAPPIAGIVRGADGKPLSGVNVVIKGTKRGTVTDAEGKFSIDAKAGEKLIISSVGFGSKEITVSADENVVITLEVSNSPLDEVQVIAYGTTTQRYSTGSVSTIKTEEIENQPITNPLQALEGRAAGLQISQGSGLPGSPVTVQIRGQNSIAAGNNPLYIVDGVPFTSTPVEILGGANGDGSTVFGSPMNAINPSDIESVSILKDADATAIYGSRGSNGVILITTKKGRPGKTHLDLNINSGSGTITRQAKTLSTEQYLSVRRDAFAISGVEPTISNAPDLTLWSQSSDFNFQKWYMGNTAGSFNGTASLSGGNDQTTFLLSGTYHHETTVLVGNTSYDRGSFHLNLNHNSTDKRFGLSTSIFYTTDDNFLSGNSNGALSDIAMGVPNYPNYDNTGKLNWTGGQENYLADALAYQKSKTDNLNANLVLRYEIFKGLRAQVNLGYNKIEINQLTPSPITSQNPIYGDPTGVDKFGTNTIRTYIAEPQLNFASSLLGGKLDLLAGSTFQNSKTNGQFFIKGGYTSDLLIESMNYGSFIYMSANTVQYKYASLFGRLSYNWKDKYLLNANFRRDGSSRFGPDKQFGNFWSVGSAWVFSNEEFFKDHGSWLSYGKLRGSLGTTGNDGIGDYGYLSTYTATSTYGSVNAIIPSAQIANPDFQWEVNHKLEIALELGLLHDHLLLTTSFYRNRSGNQLVNYALPSITGSTGYTANLPAVVQNTGWEFELNANVLKSKSLDWSISGNLTLPRNKLVSFPNLATSSYASSYVIGQPLSIIQAFHFMGVDPATGVAMVLDVDRNGSFIPNSSYNNQGGDYIIAGKTAPAWYAGLNNSFKYKGFQLDVFFQYVRQQGYNLNKLYLRIGQMVNAWDVFLPYWKKPGDQNVLPAPSLSSSLSLGQFIHSDATISDASFLRLKNVSLSYHIPDRWMNALKITGVQIYIQGQNLLTITRFKGYDPENAANPNLVIPPLKMLTAGIKCSL